MHSGMASAVISTTREKTTGRYKDFTTRFPPELNSLIFTFSVDDVRGSWEMKWTRQLTLGVVDSNWRKIALGTPRLWNYVSIGIMCRLSEGENSADNAAYAEKRLRRAEIIDEWLLRSKELPLDIKLWRRGSVPEGGTFGSDYCIIKVLNKYAHRWGRLELANFPSDSTVFSQLRCHAGLSGSSGVTLRDLTICALPSCGVESTINTTGFWFDLGVGRMLQPQRLSLTSMPVQRINAQWNNLVHLQVSSLLMAEVLFMLNESRSVQTCILTNILQRRRSDHDEPSDGKEYSLPHTPILHESLRTFEYKIVHRDTTLPSAILPYLTLPALQEMTIHNESDDEDSLDHLAMRNLHSLLTRSSCQLQKLSIHYAADISLDLHEILSVVPSLRQLIIWRPSSVAQQNVAEYDPYSWGVDNVFQHYVAQIPDPFLPHLDAFDYTGPGTFLSENQKKFAKAFYSRPSKSAQLKNIRYICIR